MALLNIKNRSNKSRSA